MRFKYKFKTLFKNKYIKYIEQEILMKLEKVMNALLLRNNIKEYQIYSILEDMQRKKIDYADIYFQMQRNENWTMENSIIKQISSSFKEGVGVRAIYQGKTGFAHSNKINIDSIKEISLIASNITNNKKNFVNVKQRKENQKSRYYNINPIKSCTNQEKRDLLFRIDKYARSINNKVKEVKISISNTYDQILLVSSDGILNADIRPMFNISISVQVEHLGKYEKSFNGGGGRFHYTPDNKNLNNLINKWITKAVNSALINLSAIQAPAGNMTVVLGPGWPGILIHEAVGHGLESDFNRKGISIFKNQIGNMVASNLCTIVDDGTIFGSRGSISIDDEGISSKYNILIENGILKKYMQDKLSAHLTGVEPTGNGRRESYAHIPMPRMTNTYMLPGKDTPADIISSVDYGIYASNFNGGQVDITSGKFVFFASEAFLIRKGKITSPIKGAMIIGSSIEIMQNISMVGDDFELDNGLGTCSKEGQNIPVSVGQPTLKIEKITVGGTNII